MEQDHLSVVGTDNTETEDAAGDSTTRRQPPRLRPQRVLPTDRLKLETQAAALRAFVRASDRGAIPVGAREVAARLQISEATAALVNSFFVEAGFVAKSGKGKYIPLPEVIEYARLYSLDQVKAAEHLAAPLGTTWYFEEVARELDGGGASEDTLVNVLAQAAGVGGERRSQLLMILEWLAYVRLIEMHDDGTVSALVMESAGDTADNAEPTVGNINARATVSGPVDTKGARPTAERGTAPPVLGFNFAFSLTADDLKKLTPEQIAATFEAVGKVIAIKAEAGIE